MVCWRDHFAEQISIIPKPELRSFWVDSPIKPPFGVTSAEVVIICLETIRKNGPTFFGPTKLIKFVLLVFVCYLFDCCTKGFQEIVAKKTYQPNNEITV